MDVKNIEVCNGAEAVLVAAPLLWLGLLREGRRNRRAITTCGCGIGVRAEDSAGAAGGVRVADRRAGRDVAQTAVDVLFIGSNDGLGGQNTLRVLVALCLIFVRLSPAALLFLLSSPFLFSQL